MTLGKKQIIRTLNYFPGLIVLCFSLIALYASVVTTQENQALHQMYEESSAMQAESNIELQAQKQSIALKEKWLYWSVWVLGLSGFVLVLMNADKLRRLSRANDEKEVSLQVLEQQLADIQKAEAEKAELQNQLHQAQKLEAVGRLAGGIAHDFNNILAAMNGYAEFLTDDLKKDSPQHGFAQSILTAGKQARELVDKMLAFSRRDRDETQQMRLIDPLNETLSMLKASLPKAVEVETNIEDEEYVIHGNSNLISQVIMNLCVNAKDAMPNEKGTLKLSLKKADLSNFQNIERTEELPATDAMPLINIEDIDEKQTCLYVGSVAEDQEYISLSVSDDGSGMSRAIMENIFEPFFTTKPVDKGTGLGLAMVHGAVASHRGAMQIKSTIGEGTQFDLLFPTLGIKKSDIVTAAVTEDWKAVGRVLLVEDQKEVRLMMAAMLKRIGFDVEDCESGLAALEVLREHPDYFNVVVSDQNMPKMSGVELVEQIAIDHPDIPFVIVTGYSLEGLRDIMKEHESIKAILRKPVEREKLKEAVQTAILERQFAA